MEPARRKRGRPPVYNQAALDMIQQASLCSRPTARKGMDGLPIRGAVGERVYAAIEALRLLGKEIAA